MTVDNAQREQDQGGRDEEASQRGRCRNGGGTTNEIVTDETLQNIDLGPRFNHFGIPPPHMFDQCLTRVGLVFDQLIYLTR